MVILLDKMARGQGKPIVRWLSKERVFEAEGTLCTKAWRREQTWSLGGAIEKPEWLHHSKTELGK